MTSDGGAAGGAVLPSPTASARLRTSYKCALPLFITVIRFTCSYGRLPTHASRREFGVTDTERATAVAIESALRPFARAHVALTLLSSDGIWPPPPQSLINYALITRTSRSHSPLQEPPTHCASPQMPRQQQLCSPCPATASHPHNPSLALPQP